MKLNHVSFLTGVIHEMDLLITSAEYIELQAGRHAQYVWFHLTPDQGEFVISGITPE